MPPRNHEKSEYADISALIAFERLQDHVGYDHYVQFADPAFPADDDPDPFRTCFFNGHVLKLENLGGLYIAHLDITDHRIQRVSEERVAPGFEEFIKEVQGVNMITAFLLLVALEYPETAIYDRLEIPDHVVQLDLEDVHDITCVGSACGQI